jgi:tetrahydromethanopterin S-methyltransferase subunit G
MSEELTRNFPDDGVGRILARLDSLDGRLNNIDTRLNNIDARLDNMDKRLELVESRLDKVDGRLDKVESRLEKLASRAYDTKPIWERVLTEMTEIGKRLESLDRRFSVLNDDVLQTRADMRRP